MTFSDICKFKEFLSSIRPALHKSVKGSPSGRRKMIIDGSLNLHK